MSTRSAHISIVVGVASLTLGCRDVQPPRGITLRTSQESCVPTAYDLTLLPDGQFVLNSETRDSVGIGRWLTDVLPKRSADGRYVNIRVAAPDRRRDLEWLVPAIQRAGGQPFARDTACHIEIPMQKVGEVSNTALPNVSLHQSGDLR